MGDYSCADNSGPDEYGNDMAEGMSMTRYDLDTEAWLNIIDFTRQGVIAINSEGKIAFINGTAARIVGTDEKSAVGCHIKKLVANTGLLEALKIGHNEQNQRIVINGHMTLANRIVIKKDGKIMGALGIFQDMSELEKLSHELESVKAVNRDLDGVFESVADGLVLVDNKGIVLRINKTYKTMTGISDEEYAGKHVHQLIEEGYIGRSLSDKVIERQAVYSTVDVRNGKELLLTANPVFDEHGNISRVITVARDTTELSNLKNRLAESEAVRNTYYEELKKLHAQMPRTRIIANGPIMKQKIELALHVAQVDSSVLILGESGTGKDLFARLIHRASKRALKSFVDINCGAVPSNLLESEFFGYEQGAFTGALKGGKQGLFELAQGGTLFLDEVGELPLDLQVKVLKAVQNKQIARIGGNKTINLDVRIIAATNRDLEKMVQEKTFRQDLFYRLNVIPIVLPPLRERKEDITPLINEFLLKFNTRYGYQKWIHPDFINCMMSYNWPGNVRELENTIERAVVSCRDDCINLDCVRESGSRYMFNSCTSLSSLKQSREREEKRALEEAYERTQSTRKTAEMLGISQPSVVKKMKKYGIPTNTAEKTRQH